MKAIKPLRAKIGKLTYRIRAGKVIPENVVNFWKETKEFDLLKKSGIISDDGTPPKDDDKKEGDRVNK